MSADASDGSESRDGGGDADTGDGRSLPRRAVATLPRKLAVVLLLLVAVLVVAYFLGIIGVPSTGLVDRGDWGTVTDDRTEIVTTLWVKNPNPVGIALGRDTVERSLTRSV
ncbi:MAG: hypothetical protein ABEJ85_06310, partial [Haloarculaceae archaeon]